MQNLKKKLIDNTIAVLGRAYQFEGNTSIYYFIGDLIKRNYKIISDYISDSLRRERAKEVTR